MLLVGAEINERRVVETLKVSKVCFAVCLERVALRSNLCKPRDLSMFKISLEVNGMTPRDLPCLEIGMSVKVCGPRIQGTMGKLESHMVHSCGYLCYFLGVIRS